MISPDFWINYWRVRRAVADYPLYDVPHGGKSENLSETEMQENFDYFMKVRHERLAYFQDWLHRKFGVRTPGFGGGLIQNESANFYTFNKYDPPFLGKYRGFNVMVDIAIFLGEYLIAKRPRLHWDIFRKIEDEEGNVLGTNLNRPVLRGYPSPVFGKWRLDLFQTGYGRPADCRKRSEIGAPRGVYYRNTLTYSMKFQLHIADLPDGDYPYVIGDYSDEPL